MPPRDGVYIIAEAGSCHMGDYKAAEQLVQSAAFVGADACKFQLFRADDIVLDGRVDPRTEMPPEWVPRLAGMCREVRIDFLCTPFAEWSVKAIEPYVWAYKVGSFEWNRKDIWDAIQKTGKPVIASCGRHEPPSVVPGPRLYCVSKYPADPQQIFLPDFRSTMYQGFSDHTTSTVVPALAVARGARFIEKHLRLPETTSDCPDFPHSLEPWQFAEMVNNIRLAEVVCFRPQPESPELSQYPNRRE